MPSAESRSKPSRAWSKFTSFTAPFEGLAGLAVLLGLAITGLRWGYRQIFAPELEIVIQTDTQRLPPELTESLTDTALAIRELTTSNQNIAAPDAGTNIFNKYRDFESAITELNDLDRRHDIAAQIVRVARGAYGTTRLTATNRSNKTLRGVRIKISDVYETCSVELAAPYLTASELVDARRALPTWKPSDSRDRLYLLGSSISHSTKTVVIPLPDLPPHTETVATIYSPSQAINSRRVELIGEAVSYKVYDEIRLQETAIVKAYRDPWRIILWVSMVGGLLLWLLVVLPLHLKRRPGAKPKPAKTGRVTRS
jgi:hypothetical protein